jgi:hypothetical protein
MTYSLQNSNEPQFRLIIMSNIVHVIYGLDLFIIYILHMMKWNLDNIKH